MWCQCAVKHNNMNYSEAIVKFYISSHSCRRLNVILCNKIWPENMKVMKRNRNEEIVYKILENNLREKSKTKHAIIIFPQHVVGPSEEINDDPHHDKEKNVAEIMKLIRLTKVHS